MLSAIPPFNGFDGLQYTILFINKSFISKQNGVSQRNKQPSTGSLYFLHNISLTLFGIKMKKHCLSKNKVGPEVKKVSVRVSEVSEYVGNFMYACFGYVTPFSPSEPKVVQFGCYHKIFGKILSKRRPKCKNLKNM